MLRVVLDTNVFIVSGDHHLLDISEYKGIPIITVHEFKEILARST